MQALRFTSPIWDLGYKLVWRMWEGGPYSAFHLRLRKDVWVQSGCLPRLGPEFDEFNAREHKSRPELLTGRLTVIYDEWRRTRLCPMNGFEVARLLRAPGAPTSAGIYLAGREPLGDDWALRELVAEYPNLITKKMLALGTELAPYANQKSNLSALDFVAAMRSDVFMQSHGGNMGCAVQGHRAFTGALEVHKVGQARSGTATGRGRGGERRIRGGAEHFLRTRTWKFGSICNYQHLHSRHDS